MIVEYRHGIRERIAFDCVVCTVEMARDYIRDGATNGVELLVEAGMTEREAEAEVARIEAAMA